MVKIIIDEELCTGCAACEAACEELFEMKDDGKARVKKQEDLPCLKDAVDSCPSEAIRVE